MCRESKKNKIVNSLELKAKSENKKKVSSLNLFACPVKIINNLNHNEILMRIFFPVNIISREHMLFTAKKFITNVVWKN